MKLSWVKCGDEWCDFFNVDLADNEFDNAAGIYIIWVKSGPTIFIGQGVIRYRLRNHRKQKEFLDLRNEELLVTWAHVEEFYRDNVERNLADRLSPCITSFHPVVRPIVVNLPGE